MKAFTVFMALVMIVHVIRPLGLPGLRRRSDAWKLPLATLFILVIVAALGGG